MSPLSTPTTMFSKKEKKEKPAPMHAEDIGLVIGTPDQVMWTEVVNGYKTRVEQMKREVIVNEVFLKAAEDKLKSLDV